MRQDTAAVDAALTKAKAIDDRPSLIVARTHIGYGSPHKHDTFVAHGEPLGVEEVRLTKRALGWPEDKVFYIPDEALAQFRKAVEQGRELDSQWNRRVDALGAVDPKAAGNFRQVLTGETAERMGGGTSPLHAGRRRNGDPRRRTESYHCAGRCHT